MDPDKVDELLERIDPDKRAFLKGLVMGTAFVVPTVASVSMDGLSLHAAHAQQISNLPA
jgi:hypothetical protein